jgi:hypothetical protein
MKNLILIILAVFLAVSVISCKKETTIEKVTQQKTQYFQTLDEASKKAKSDLLEILKMEKDIKLNIDVKELEQSNPQGSVKHYSVDFNKFISGDSLRDLKAISTDDGVSIVPFVYENRIIASAFVNKDKNGWAVGGLSNDKITDDLNKIKQILKETPKFEINYFEVPNIDAHIYQAADNSSVRYFADYKDVFNVQKEVKFPEIVNVLKRDAIEFQKKYGEELKKGKLVK